MDCSWYVALASLLERRMGAVALVQAVLGKALCPWALEMGLSQWPFPASPSQLNFALFLWQVSWGKDSCPFPSSWKLLMAWVWDCFLTLSQGKMVFFDPSTSPGGSSPEPWGLKCSLASPFLRLSAWEKMRAGCHVFSTAPAASLLQVCTLRKAFSENPVEIDQRV